MICPQQRLQTLINNNNVHKSISVGLSGCQTDESSTDECSFVKSSSNRHYGKKPYSKMSHINEQDVFSSRESLNERNIEGKKKKHISIKTNNTQFVFFLQYHHYLIITINKRLLFFLHHSQRRMLIEKKNKNNN